MKDLNDKLKNILKDIKPSWDGQGYKDIVEIEDAIKSKYRDRKIAIINKYNV